MKATRFVLSVLFSLLLLTQTQAQSLKVLTKPIEPFVSDNSGEPTGFSIELWDMIAQERGWTTPGLMICSAEKWP